MVTYLLSQDIFKCWHFEIFGSALSETSKVSKKLNVVIY